MKLLYYLDTNKNKQNIYIETKTEIVYKTVLRF